MIGENRLVDLAKRLLTFNGPGPKIKYKDIGDGYYAQVISINDGGGESFTGLTYEQLLEAKIGTREYDWANIISISVQSSSTPTANAVGVKKEYELTSDTDCYFLVGSAPVATTSSRFLPAGVSFTLQLNANDKIAVIRKSADGKLTILPIKT